MNKLLHKSSVGVVVLIIVSLLVITTLGIFLQDRSRQTTGLYQINQSLTAEKLTLEDKLSSISAELTRLQNEDQKVRNDTLEEEIENIQNTYNSAVSTYESLVKLKEKDVETTDFDAQLAESLALLSERDYETAASELTDLSGKIQQEEEKLAQESAPAIPETIAVNNDPPANGYSRQSVATDFGNYLVSMHAADLSTTRVIVDTASDSTCHNDCPTLPLATYISRNGAYAGVNGSYFCPAEYPSCAGKTNSFDTLLMNKDNVYFNSENNTFSTVPVVIFGNGWIRFEHQSLNWGRDTSVDGVIANQPLLVSGGSVVFGGDGDPKKGSKAGRSFVANKGNTVYIGVVHSATVAEAAIVLQSLGMENALNLDSGGSTAFWSNGYKAGPGRNIPNAILFVGK